MHTNNIYSDGASITSIDDDPSIIDTNPVKKIVVPDNYPDAALFWYRFGFDVIPIEPNLKHPVLKWDPWLESLSEDTIQEHWKVHPEHHVGLVVGDKIIIFDADAPESVSALYQVEKQFGVKPFLRVRTTRGEHHYFVRKKGTKAKSDAHSTDGCPERLDVKTGRAIVVLPPSGGKVVIND